MTSIEKMYKLGILSGILGNDDSKKVAYADFLKYLPTAEKLTQTETEALVLLKNRGYSDLKKQSNRIKEALSSINLAHNEKMRKEFEGQVLGAAQKNIIEKKALSNMVSDIGFESGFWNKDLGRISDFVMHTAFEEGRADSFTRNHEEIVKDSSGDILVYKDVYPGACRHCIKHYLTSGIGSQPKIFSLKKLEANGTNIGKKQAEWLPVLGPMHPFCFKLDSTLFLTDKGFKKYYDIVDEKLLTLNLKTEQPEFQPIKERVNYSFSGNLYKIGSSLGLWSIGNHDFLGRKRVKLKGERFRGEIEKIKAKDLTSETTMYNNVNSWKEVNKDKDINIGGKQYNKSLFIEFMGWWLAEGSISRKSITICQTKNKEKKEIEILLTKLFGVDGWYYSNPHFYVVVKKLDFSYFLQFGKSSNKFIPTWIKESSKADLLRFLSIYLKGDGSVKQYKENFKGKGRDRVIYTTSNRMVGDLSELISKVGFSPKISLIGEAGREWNIKGKSGVCNYNLYAISLLKYSNYTLGIKETIQVKDVEVGCFETLNGTLFVMDEAVMRPMWVGNCRCTLNYVPQGFDWDEKTKDFTKPSEKFERKVERKSKIKITVGNRKYEV